MENFIMEQFNNLPPLLQFLLAALFAASPPTSILAFAFAWVKGRQTAQIERQRSQDKLAYDTEIGKQKERLESLELKQKIQEAEAEQARLDRQNTRTLMEGMFRDNERWQKVTDTGSERRLEEARLRRESDSLLTNAINNQTATLLDLKSAFEILTTVQGNVKTTVDTGVQTVIAKAEDTQKDVSSIKSELSFAQHSIEKLTTRIDELILLNESNVQSQNERHTEIKQDNAEQKTELAAINTGLKTTNTILEKLLGRMESTQPIPALPENIETENKKSA